MPAGTITLTNNSTTVTGSGTAFPTELKANDFLVAVVGGTTYTLGVKSVESATALTFTTAYGGPTTGGLAWTPIPNGTLVGITAQIAADTARAIRGLNYDKQNWQQVYSASGNVSVTLPDGSSYTGPSWKYLSDSLAQKVNSNDASLSSINGKSGGTVNGSVLASPGNEVGLADSVNPNGIKFRNEAGTISPGSFVNYISSKWYVGGFNLGTVRGDATDVRAVQMYVYSDGSGTTFNFYPDGRAVGNWQPASDERIKDIEGPVENPLEKMRTIRGQKWVRLDSGLTGFGFTAQDVRRAFPEAVSVIGDIELKDGSTVKDALTPDTYGVAAALHHEAILALMDKIEVLESTIKGIASTASDDGSQSNHSS